MLQPDQPVRAETQVRLLEDPDTGNLTAFCAVRRLPEELRAVVILRYFAGYTQAETARALNIPQGTAATRQRRALQLLRLELGEEGDA